MVTRQKLELPLNQPMNLELLYDEPVIGQNKFGSYFLYAVKSGDSEFSFFAPEQIHEELQNLRRGDTAVVTKLAANKNGKLVTTYAVERKSNCKQSENDKQQIKTDIDKPEINGKSTEQSDRFYEIMLQSYCDAIRIQSELNGLTDVSRIAITLFIARSKLPFNSN